ncbi:uncharacterized protein LOC110341720 isoform X2 [Mesocricetus auratus]|uniref:Uncharacterized protein LOC110341720 isoform X2 n=1 Tax=Mesocricetus auratus TaxID=10036 RepID=A0A3Q0CSK4_MESAU|nr:uncharacterized protein LOC110341720 isoform X2 [Mesocricetus auratus]
MASGSCLQVPVPLEFLSRLPSVINNDSEVQQEHGPWQQHRPRTQPLATVRPQTQTRPSEAARTTYVTQLGLRWLCRPLTSIWPPEAARCSDINNGFQWQPRPWTSARPPVATWTMDINTDTGCSRNTDPHIALGNSTGMDITMTSDGSPGCSHQAGPHHHHIPGSASLHRAHTALLLLSLAYHSSIYYLCHKVGGLTVFYQTPPPLSCFSSWCFNAATESN